MCTLALVKPSYADSKVDTLYKVVCGMGGGWCPRVGTTVRATLGPLAWFGNAGGVEGTRDPGKATTFYVDKVHLPFLFLLLSRPTTVDKSIATSVVYPATLVGPVAMEAPEAVLPYKVEFNVPSSFSN